MRRIAWNTAICATIAIGLYVGSFMAAWRIGSYHSHHNAAGDFAFYSLEVLPPINLGPGPPGEHEPTTYQMTPAFVDTFYRPILCLAEKDQHGNPNCVAVYLLGIKR